MPQDSESRFSRRKFLRRTAGSAAALGAAPAFLSSCRAAEFEKGSSIHPNLDELRVVGVHDDAMTDGDRGRISWEQQEERVNWDPVQTNMDRMACALAEEEDPEKAWKAIFVKPPNKNWSDVVVAIKSNHIFVQRSRSAVVSKLCHALTDVVGVKGENIFLYDACHGDKMSTNTQFEGLPDGVHLANKWGGFQAEVTVARPYFDGSRTTKCMKHLATDEVDILVDLALCKGHNMTYGGFTMAMKNHFGTFNPRLGHQEQGANYLIGINKTPHVLGKMDDRGRVTFPRQQICLVDALWGSDPGPSGTSTHQLNRLYMAPTAPALDYQVATKLRQQEMGWQTNRGMARKFLTSFGYSPDQLPNNGEIIDALEYA